MSRQWKFSILGAILLIAMLFTLHYSRQYFQQNAMDDAVRSLERVLNNADMRLHQTEIATDSLLPLIEQHLDNPDIMFDYSRKLLEDHPGEFVEIDGRNMNIYVEGDIELPATLAGTYTIEVIRGSQTFVGEITL